MYFMFHYQQLGELLFIKDAKKKKELQSLIEISLKRSGGTENSTLFIEMIGNSQNKNPI